MHRFSAILLRFGGALLCITGTAKIISAFGTTQILFLDDPVFLVPNRIVFVLVGSIELGLGLFCLFAKPILLKAIFLALLSTDFLIYRAGLKWVGYQQPCSCMGNLFESIHVSSIVAHNFIVSVLIYLIVSSYGVIIGRAFYAPSLSKCKL